MNFEESSVQKELRNLTRKFVQKELFPLIEKDEASETFRPEVIKKLGELGLTGISVSEAYGGAGLGYSDFVVVLEEIAKASTSYAISVSVTGLPQTILSRFGSEEQKSKYIPPLASGDAIGAFSLSEPSAGSNASALRLAARREDDHYVLSGTKLWCTQGDVAETLIVLARTGGEGSAGVSAFVVERGTPGFELGKREKKMGCHISHTMELVFKDAKIPSKNLIGKEGEGMKTALSALDSGRITIGSIAVGVAQAAFDVALGHSRLREQFGQPIGDFQGVSFMLADMATQIAAARHLVRHAAWLRDQGEEPYSLQAAMAKCFATDMAMKVTTDAVQILGGSGYTQDFPVERYMREAKVLQIVEGTNQIQRMLIGRELAKGAEKGAHA